METKRAFTAIMLSLMILLGYQYFFVPPPQEFVDPALQEQTEKSATISSEITSRATPVDTYSALSPDESLAANELTPAVTAKDITVITSQYTAVISENGGGIKSFKLHNYKESTKADSPLKQLIFTEQASDLPLQFSWGNGISSKTPLYQTNQQNIQTSPGQQAVLSMAASLLPGLEVERSLVFSDDSYTIDLEFTVRNNTVQALQGAPYLKNTNRPFDPKADKNINFLFTGPAVYLNDALEEIKPDDLQDDGPKTLSGKLSWAAYEDTYFLCGIIPQSESSTVQLSVIGDDKVSSIVSGAQEIIAPGEAKTFKYTLYLGPKKLSILKQVGSNLDRVINFGWFDVLAKPALFLLNFFHKYIGNYGIAVILVTVLFKLLFWPITHKGMKSMKTMQKIQPKMAKLREKFKDDKERLNQEMITLYKTYKINPLGGCLPMVLQIPVFFALYKVLLQTIELRHAPFMLWITDLSAPDRLPIGLDIPYLGGIPVLTLLMGASMFLQQKMTPTAADPTQAKIMLFLPVIFTFMFLNFASGLVLYWFINNLLSICQQYFINKSVD
nr:membrane protein insertase YidC [Desulfobulbaceae bacterium]